MQSTTSSEGHPMTFNPYSLTQILYFDGAITSYQAKKIKRIQKEREEKSLPAYSGEIAIELGYITRSQLEDAIREKEKFCVRDSCNTENALRQARLDLAEVLLESH